MEPISDTKTATQWRVALDATGNSLAWLAEATGTSARAVYSYSAWKPGMTRVDHGRRPNDAWLAKVSAVLGVEVVR